MSASDSTIYILYNANASLLGKLNYACRKITASTDSSPCAACDLTHGGLKLDESAAWKKTKARIGAKVEQLHRDESTSEVRDFIKANSLKYPVVLGRAGTSPLKVLLKPEDLSTVSADHSAFLALLARRAEEEKIPLVIEMRFVPEIITPGHLTLAALVTGLGACLCSIATDRHTSAWAVYLWLLNRVLDCLDGAAARERGTTSDAGGFLDLLSDFIIYSLVPISVACGEIRRGLPADDCVSLLLSVSLLEATFHINNFILFYLAALSSQKGNDELTAVTMKPALVEGFESGIFFTLMLAIPSLLQLLTLIMAAGVCIGIASRTWLILDAFAAMKTQPGHIRVD
ncbi:hypothetical protein LTS17_008932 [Exophiala oligosperma]